MYINLPQHPVYCVNVVGTQNAHNLISVSNDGKMCSWSLDMLSQPQVGVLHSPVSWTLLLRNVNCAVFTFCYKFRQTS